MELKAFQEKQGKKTGIIIGIISIVLLLAVVFVYRTYSIYQEQQEFDVIKGSVPDQNYDIMFTFYLEDENGTKSVIQTVPEDKEYRVSVICNNEASGSWDYDSWGPVITNLNKTRTKCSITFSKVIRPLKEYGIMDTVVEEGNGLYEVEHSDANITYTTDTTAINNLKITEYRYAGSNPNNYVTFNGEEAGWRIIGLVNTPEGQRIKLIRNESIGNYSWDSSSYDINSGAGISEWSQADLQELLNSGAYYNRTTGTCYNGWGNQSVSCDFRNTGLNVDAKSMIDTTTWNLGTSPSENYFTEDFYDNERSFNVGKLCNSGTYCNDTVTRTLYWKGKVGLMYVSDYGYATGGGTTITRKMCLVKNLREWDSSSDCYINNWLTITPDQWTMISYASSVNGNQVIHILNNDPCIYGNSAGGNYSVIPSLYLKTNVKLFDGDGSKKSPYHLKFD